MRRKKETGATGATIPLWMGLSVEDNRSYYHFEAPASVGFAAFILEFQFNLYIPMWK